MRCVLQASPKLETARRFFGSRSSVILDAAEDFYANLLSGYAQTSEIRHGRAIHANFIKATHPPSLFLHNHILNMYVRCGKIQEALNLFDEMRQRNVVSWSAIISGFARHGLAINALSLFSRMHHEGMVKPNEFTLVSTLSASSLYEDLTSTYQIYALVIRLGFVSNVFLGNAFLTAFIRHGKLLEALEFFRELPGKDVVSWNAMIDGYLQYSCRDMTSFWVQMNQEGVRPDGFTFATVLTGFAATNDLHMGLQVHGQVVKSGHGDDVCVGNALVDMYVKNSKLQDGFQVFHDMPQRDVCLWTRMAAGCLQSGEPEKALNVINEMKKMGVNPNKLTLAAAINACACVTSLDDGRKVHGLRVKLGNEVDACVDNALVDMYSKCGSMDGAWTVFRSMSDRSVVTYTTMIMGCAQNGQAKEALKTFDDMILEGIEPNYITFICLLYACSQGGFVDEAWKYFSSMTQVYGISPAEDHYACMVILLGRAGCIKEAEELILSMPFQPGPLIWQTLLGVCQIHGDVETAKRAAESAMSVDKLQPSSYVLLSNVLAELKDWHAVGKLRQHLKGRDIKKRPGSSWMNPAYCRDFRISEGKISILSIIFNDIIGLNAVYTELLLKF